MSMENQRRDYRTKPDVWAECQDCGWSSRARNAWGTGVQHSRRKQHEVRIEVDRVFIYGRRPTAQDDIEVV